MKDKGDKRKKWGNELAARAINFILNTKLKNIESRHIPIRFEWKVPVKWRHGWTSVTSHTAQHAWKPLRSAPWVGRWYRLCGWCNRDLGSHVGEHELSYTLTCLMRSWRTWRTWRTWCHRHVRAIPRPSWRKIQFSSANWRLTKMLINDAWCNDNDDSFPQTDVENNDGAGDVTYDLINACLCSSPSSIFAS